jgi:spermidine dehydrogenase
MSEKGSPIELGSGESITRRDFVDGVLGGAAMLALGGRAGAQAAPIPPGLGPDWYGYGGVGDYAPSHGNTPELIAQAHSVRDGQWSASHIDASDTGEAYDLIIVGGGMTGLGAALQFTQKSRPGARALLIENHPVLGGESKRNEFIVDGTRLFAPQGAQGFSVPGPSVGGYANGDARYFEELSIPREYTYAPWPTDRKELKFPTDDAGFLHWFEREVSDGWFVDEPGSPGRWVHDPWAKDLAGTQYSAEDRAQLIKWRQWSKRIYDGPDFEKWLDARSYAELLTQDAGLGSGVLNYVSTLTTVTGGPIEAVSAYSAYNIRLPVASAFSKMEAPAPRQQWPGGNDVFARYFIKRIAPHVLEGGTTLPEIVKARIRFEALDRPDARVRFRVRSTAIRIEHVGKASDAAVRVTYLQNGRAYSVRAQAVVMATGGWITKYIVRDLPASHLAAYNDFVHMPVMIANVALRNWRPMYNLGLTSFKWKGDLGSACAIKRPMYVGDFQPPLDPDRPTVISLTYPICPPGADVRTNVKVGRAELYATPFAEYERRIREHFTRLFGAGGFDARKDIGGIILNRWGHAWIVPTPGFYFGRNGAKAGREIIREPFGRIAFGHSELHGNQHWGPAAAEGSRAFDQIAPFLRT